MKKIYDINTVVFNYTNFPTKRSETRNDMVHSLIKMLTKANRDLTYYISDLKQSKCIEPFCRTSCIDSLIRKRADSLCSYGGMSANAPS